MKRFVRHLRGRDSRCLLLLVLLAGLGLGLSGCSSTEPDNASARPWNSPRGGWDSGGLPGGMMEGR